MRKNHALGFAGKYKNFIKRDIKTNRFKKKSLIAPASGVVTPKRDLDASKPFLSNFSQLPNDFSILFESAPQIQKTRSDNKYKKNHSPEVSVLKKTSQVFETCEVLGEATFK
ncbi:MAG: hypothetical protein Q8J97_07585 [Flavobacteriaceae bacterium]|nr:hypothetical protein [Flavobacteriaceae bacterium]